MTLTNQEAEELLREPKFVRRFLGRKQYERVSEYTLPSDFPLDLRLNLEADSGNLFLLKIWQSQREMLKVSLHHHESAGHVGLLRVDFHGAPHDNPSQDELTNLVPEKIRSYAGYQFVRGESHIHYYVEGFPPLRWALPLNDDGFAIKNLANSGSIGSALHEFGRAISLQTSLILNEPTNPQ